MTDNEIIKAFEICYVSDEDCSECPFCDEDMECTDIGDSHLLQDVFELINRKDKEIERLQEENKNYKLVIEAIKDTINPLPFETDFDKAIKTAKSEAIKEFADKISKHIRDNFAIDKTKNADICFAFIDFMNWLDEQSTADVVEVCRCSECKHLKIIKKEPIYAECEKQKLTFLLWQADTREHSCSYGERK